MRLLRTFLGDNPAAQAALDQVAAAVMSQAGAGDALEMEGLCTVRDHRSPQDGRTSREVIEDVEWLADSGFSWEHIVRTIGRSPKSLERLLERHGRTDLLTRTGARRKRVRA